MKTEFLKNVAKLFSLEAEKSKEVKMDQAALPDGTIVEADSFEVGQAAFVPVEDGESIPVPEGIYDLDNGMTIRVDDLGIIQEVTETAAAPDPDAIETPEELARKAAAAKGEQVKAQAKKIIESTVKETVFSQTEVDALILAAKIEVGKEVAEMKLSIDSKSKEIEALKVQLNEEPATKKLNRKPEKREVGNLNGRHLSSKTSRRGRILDRISNFEN